MVGKTYKSKMGIGRTEKQIDQDFDVTCQLLEENLSWAEISMFINNIRKYSVSINSLKRAYKLRIQNAALEISPVQEKLRTMEDLDSVMFKAMKEFESSKKPKKSVEKVKQNIPKKQEDGTIVMHSVDTMVKTKQTTSTGNAVYLKTFMDAALKRIQLIDSLDLTDGLDEEFQVVDEFPEDLPEPYQSESDIGEEI